MRFQIGTNPVENLVEVKLQPRSNRLSRPFGRFRDIANGRLTSTNNSRYWFVKMY
jgi:hypothetical protein